MPSQRVGIVQFRVRDTARSARPLAVRLNEQGPVGLVLRETLAVLLGLVVDLANRFARGQSVRCILNAGLIHESLPVYLRAVEPDAALKRRAGKMLDDDICVVRGSGVHTGGELARG